MKWTISACAATCARHGGGRRLRGDETPGGKGAAACGALTFRAVASGASDGEQQAGYYRSRYGSLALHADVKQGQPVDYFVLADGKRLAAAPAALPDWAANCAVAKKLPKPAAAEPRLAPVSGFKVASCPCRQRAAGAALRVSTAPLGIFAAPAPIDRDCDVKYRRHRGPGHCQDASGACKLAVINCCG